MIPIDFPGKVHHLGLLLERWGAPGGGGGGADGAMPAGAGGGQLVCQGGRRREAVGTAALG